MFHKPENGIGYLTIDQWERLQWAFHDATKLIPWLKIAGYVKTTDLDTRIQSSNTHPLGMPPTLIAALEINRLIHELNPYELEEAANNTYLAQTCLNLIREVETAKHHWPYQDRPHRVKYMNCLNCNRETLKYYPPQQPGQDIQVKCTNCHTTLDQTMFAHATALIQHQTQTLKIQQTHKNRARGI